MGKHKLHKSHKAAWYRGLLYCSSCGHFSLKGQSLRALAQKCQINPGGRYCPMTMNLIRHGTKRAGFKDWPTYDNKPGKEEPEIARCAVPDPEWIKEPPPRTYNTSKTITGENIAKKIRDLRLRRHITGTTSMPRLRQKTHPMQIRVSEEIDFEEAVAEYEQDIQKDIDKYKKQEYVAPEWVKEALGHPQDDEGNRAKETQAGTSRSSWEGPITDSQAVHISDLLLTEQEEQELLADEEPGTDGGPSWETSWFSDLDSGSYPADLRPYSPEAYDAF